MTEHVADLRPAFVPFPKIARLNRPCVITEKIDGTNASIYIGADGTFLAGSRNRWLTPEADNFGFAGWAYSHKEVLLKLGTGTHFGEWWGLGIQRGYGLKEQRFSLFNTFKWGWLNTVTPEQNPLAGVVGVVPSLYSGPFSTQAVNDALAKLRSEGSQAAPGFLKPEGIVVYHEAARTSFKVTLENDTTGKEQA